jgi:ABC-type branched-subunit amino acid transport system ATPase component/branched-subunit amino acid ABC-type transport system permease component
MLIYIVAGLTTGSIFGLAAVGVVLTYKTSGIFNFAHGALATLAAFLFYFLHTEHHVPWPIAAVICVGVGGPVLGFVLEWVARHLATHSLATKVMGTVGLLLLIQGGLNLLYRPGPYRGVTQFLPTGSFSLAGTAVQYYRLIIFGVGLLAMVGLTAYLRRSRSGLAMRGVVDDPDLLDISGTSPTRIRRYAWVIGSTTAAGSGVLLAPLLPLDTTTLTLLIVTAFGAAAIGAFTSLPLTYVGGLGIGIAQALLEKYITNSSGLLTGLSASLPFLLLFLLLLFAPRLRRPSAARIPLRSRAAAWTSPPAFRFGGLAVVVVVLCFVPSFAALRLEDWTRFLAYVIVFLSLGLLVRISGQVSLAQVSFMAIGVCAFSQLAAVHHLPWLVALVVASLLAAPIGAVLAIPAIRFPGLYLALATLGFGILVEQMFYTQNYMFGTSGLGTPVPLPHVAWLGLAGAKGYYYVVLLVAAAMCAVVVGINHSRLGRLLRAMGDSPQGLASSGASINVSRVIVFSIAASLAALGGILDGGALGTVGSDYYDPLLSLQLFVVVLLAVGELPWYAVLAAAAQILVPSYISVSATTGYALSAIFGISALQLAMVGPERRQTPARVRHAIDRYFSSSKRRTLPVAAQRPVRAPEAGERTRYDTNRPPTAVGSGLRLDQVSVRYGGLIAADGISLTAPMGRITGLIGPNGAGKTTVFNACAGLVNPSAGHVYLDDRSLDRLGPAARARRGLGRTFQQMELFDSLTVRENVALGCEGANAGLNPIAHLMASRRQRSEAAERAIEALDLCGLSELAEERVRNLTTGQRRLVELARCLAGHFPMLLLDEPSSGLDQVETQRIGDVLERVVRERQQGVLLIEHDMALVNRICDYLYVIDFGKHLFDGTTAAARASAEVRAAYLGDADVAPDQEAEGKETERPVPATATKQRRGALDSVATSVLAFKDVTSGYGDTTVLRGVSFDVRPGQVVAVLGPNGAGKTTLLRTASGILRPSSGSVTLEGADVTGDPPFQRAQNGLCLIPEGRGIFRSLTIRENLRLQLSAHEPHPDEVLERALNVFPALRDRMKQVAGTLSGGQQQMVALARAYVAHPKVILLDEISMGLAPLVVGEMFQAMQNLADEGIAMVLVEQYVSRAIDMADAVVLLNKGVVSYNGLSSELDAATVLRSYLSGESTPSLETL